RDPGHRIEVLSEAAAQELLDTAERHLGGPARQVLVRGRTERRVVEAATGADLLVCARDGDRSRLGPHSLGPMTRFVVDHAPCPVLLVWPEEAPPTELPPPPPPHGPGRHH
ncbi:universal stress protein, partial [Streptomyces sp. NPDC005968]